MKRTVLNMWDVPTEMLRLTEIILVCFAHVYTLEWVIENMDYI
jgi:hypothetical protein